MSLVLMTQPHFLWKHWKCLEFHLLYLSRTKIPVFPRKYQLLDTLGLSFWLNFKLMISSVNYALPQAVRFNNKNKGFEES